ncbi:hypothetical protein KA013_00780 [Patescibacteria group bacterium]|nr:hypothetical protein [Patescibacteria group bacterium]
MEPQAKSTPLHIQNQFLTPAERVAVKSIFLIAPGALMLYVIQHNINVVLPLYLLPREPNMEPDEGSNLLVTSVALIFMVILPVIALIRNIKALKKRAPGSSLLSHHLNFLLAISVVLFLILLVGSIVVDQYPCWVGVGNCN